jgi:hypothetical protein
LGFGGPKRRGKRRVDRRAVGYEEEFELDAARPSQNGKDRRWTNDNDGFRDVISRLSTRRRVAKARLERLDELTELALTLDVDDGSSSVEHTPSNGSTSVTERFGLDEEVEEGDDVIGGKGRSESTKGLGDGESDVERIRSVERFLPNHAVLVEPDESEKR